MDRGHPRQILLFSLVALTLSAGASRADPADPWEPMNRKFYAVQDGLDHILFKPVATTFGVFPSPLRKGLRNFSRNLGEPVVMVNYMLQGRFGHAGRTMARFSINSTFGLAGVVDVAKKGDLRYHDNSFGTTLGRWGFQPGPYIFLPLVGPSTLRDGFGSVVDIGFDPLTYSRFPYRTEIGIGLAILDGLNALLEAKPELEAIQQTSTDPYATLRSYYLQNRQAEITDKPLNIETLPEFDTPATPAPEPPAVSQPEPDAPPPAAGDTAASPPPAVPDPPATPPVSPPGPTP